MEENKVSCNYEKILKLKQCIELAIQSINFEKLLEDMKPLFKIANETTELALKNYNFIKNKSE